MHSRIGDGVIQIDTLLGGLGARDRRLPRRGRRPGARRDGQPELDPGAARRARRPRRRARRPGRCRRHPHPSRSRRRRGRRREGVPEGDGVRAREGGSPSRRPDPPRAFRRHGLRASARLALRTPRTHGGRAPARARRRRGGAHLAEPHAHDRRLARPREAPPRVARLAERHLVRRRRGRVCACPTPASFGRRPHRPTSISSWRSRRCASSSTAAPPRSPSPTTGSCPTRSTRCGRRRASCGSGPKSPRPRSARAVTSPKRSTLAFSAQLSGTDPEHRTKLETLNGVHSNAAGFRRWLETRGTHDHSHGHPHPH